MSISVLLPMTGLALLLSGRAALADDADQDRKLLARLEAIRLEKAQVKDGHFDFARAEASYQEALRAAGLDVEKLTVAEAADRIRAKPQARALAVALDDWAAVCQDARRKGRLVAVARAADPDPWRNKIRDALLRKDRPALKQLAANADLATQPPTTVGLLAAGLARAGDDAEAVRVLRRAWWRHPADFWINFQLATSLTQLRPARWDEAVGYFRAALAVRPQNPAVLVNLGAALEAKGDADEAVTALRQALTLDPKFAGAWLNLGRVLGRQGKLDEALAACRKAIELKPDLPAAYGELGDALRRQRKLDEALAAYRKALALDPRDARGHLRLGNVLRDKGRFDEAMAEYRTALELNPADAGGHLALANVLRDTGRLDDAVGACRQAIRLDPKLAAAHRDLGAALRQQGKLAEATASYRKALALDPRDVVAYLGLGTVLQDTGRLEEAIASFRQALRLDPQNAAVRAALERALRQAGKAEGQ
jgi:tetratricopeptide (TPR) repeat protein